MSLRTFFFALVASSVAASAIGCSSSSNDDSTFGFGDPATCKFVQDKNNCLMQMLVDVDACLAADTTAPSGVMSTDGVSCTSTDGRVSVAFNPPLATSSSEPRGYDATIKNASGATCAHYIKDADDNGYSLTDANGKTARLVYTGPHQVKFTCPDGSGWQDNDQDLCLIVVPGETTTSWGSSGVQVNILNLTHPLFRCTPSH
jgi:hypothetical protein